MKRFKNWSYGGVTIESPEAKELADRADEKEWERTIGLSDLPIKQGIEARYFSFPPFGVLKYFNSNFEKRAIKFEEINKRLEWLNSHGERTPFIFGLGERVRDKCDSDNTIYKDGKLNYVFMDNLEGEQLHNILLHNIARGFGPRPKGSEKWDDLFDDERQLIINYLVSRIALMSKIPQEDYNQLIRGMTLVYGQELGFDLLPQNFIYSENVKPKFGFYDLRKLGNNPDLPFDTLSNSLYRVCHEIFDTLKSKNVLDPDLQENLSEQVKTYYSKIVTASMENAKLRKVVLDNNSEKSLVRESIEPKSIELHKIHTERLEEVLR